jgi:ArsR family transcriptional regulator
MSTSCCEPKTPGKASDLDVDDVSRMCKALGHPARLRLFKHLVDFGECYFGSLTDVLPLAPSTISKHVTILKEAGLILGSSDEQRMCYCVNLERLSQLQLAVASL